MTAWAGPGPAGNLPEPRKLHPGAPTGYLPGAYPGFARGSTDQARL